MPATELSREISRVGQELLNTGLALNFQPPALRIRGRGEQHLVIPSRESPYLIGLNPIDDFKRILRNRLFTLVLLDGSVVQLSFAFRREELVGYRFVFLPCPYDFDGLDLSQLLEETSLEDLLDLVGNERLRMRGPVRFDYAPAAARPQHPASHLHVSGAPGRVGVFGPLSLGHFLRFVFQSFYPDAWNAHEFLRAWPCDPTIRSLRREEEAEMFIEQRRRL